MIVSENSPLVKYYPKAFAEIGARFTRIPRQRKKPQDKGWQKGGYSLDQALVHAKRGGNIGVLLGDSIVCLDLDSDFGEFCVTFPYLAHTWRTTRPDAPNRGKLFFRILGPAPPNRTHKTDRKAQLLSHGRQAVIYGQHPDGAYYLTDTKTYPLREATANDLDGAWRLWTGEELVKEPEVPNSAPRRRRTERRPDDLVAQVKAAWPTALEVFEHHSLASQVEREGRDQWRLLGNGGLICGDGGKAWQWYCHTQEIGGDQIDGWGWVKYGARWDRHNAAIFKAVLHEMADAAGIPVQKQGHKGDLPDLERLKGWAASWGGWNRRTRETDRAAYLELLYLAEEKGTDTLDVGCRELAERVGCGHDTASKALTRLAGQGLIEVAEQPDAYHAASWRICSEIGHTPSAGVMCPTSLHILNGDDAFMWGSRIAPDRMVTEDCVGSIGPTGKSFLAALLMQNDLSVSDIAQRTGMHRITAGKKAHTLAALRLLKLRKVGRTVVCHLVGHWRTLLDSLRRRMTTFGRGLRRRIEHVTHRIGHAVWLLQHLPDRLAELRGRILSTWERAMAMKKVLEVELRTLLGEVGCVA